MAWRIIMILMQRNSFFTVTNLVLTSSQNSSVYANLDTPLSDSSNIPPVIRIRERWCFSLLFLDISYKPNNGNTHQRCMDSHSHRLHPQPFDLCRSYCNNHYILLAYCCTISELHDPDWSKGVHEGFRARAFLYWGIRAFRVI